jgi:hypothetical protein
MSGFIAGFDGDSPDTIKAMAHRLHETGVDVPLPSILTPFRGSDAYQKMASEGRFLADRGWEFFNGYNVTFRPKHLSPDKLLSAHRNLWSEAFSVK